jgi:SPP1 family predicted phage head-tail adaptor
MRAGRLNHRIRLLAESRTQDTFGEPIRTYATTATVWAEKRALTGKERFVADRLTDEVDMTFRVRYATTVAATMRIVDEDTITYDVVAAFDPTGNRAEKMILAHSVRPPEAT